MMLYRSYAPKVGDLQPEVMPEDNARMRGACRRIIDQFNDEYDLRAKSRDAYNAIENPITTPHAMSAVRMLFVLNKFEIDYVDKCIVKEDRPIGTLVSDTENSNRESRNAELRQPSSGTEMPADSKSKEQERAGGTPALRTNDDSENSNNGELTTDDQESLAVLCDSVVQNDNQGKPRVYSYRPRVTTPSANGIIIAADSLGCDTAGFEDFDPKQSVRKKYSLDTSSKGEQFTAAPPRPQANAKAGTDARQPNGDSLARKDELIAEAQAMLELVKQSDDIDMYRMLEFDSKTILHHLRGDPKPPDPVYQNDGTLEQFEQIMKLVESGASEQEIKRKLANDAEAHSHDTPDQEQAGVSEPVERAAETAALRMNGTRANGDLCRSGDRRSSDPDPPDTS